MDRRVRRERTEKVTRKRWHRLVDFFGEELALPGFLKKNNGLTDKKKSSRLWFKIYKEKQESIHERRRNPNWDSEKE
jgi:hypothetical protein